MLGDAIASKKTSLEENFLEKGGESLDCINFHSFGPTSCINLCTNLDLIALICIHLSRFTRFSSGKIWFECFICVKDLTIHISANLDTHLHILEHSSASCWLAGGSTKLKIIFENLILTSPLSSSCWIFRNSWSATTMGSR